MQKFETLTAVAAPLFLPNIDTDVIMPKQFLKRIDREGLAEGVFHDLRRQDDGSLRKDFPLNQARYADAKILVAGRNFGCGSSREHAAWALLDMGITCVIAPSFSDIFAGNAFKNGILTVALPQEQIDRLLEVARGHPITVDLDTQTVTTPFQDRYQFDVDPFRKECLENGLDEVGLTMARDAAISNYETRAAKHMPWMSLGLAKSENQSGEHVP